MSESARRAEIGPFVLATLGLGLGLSLFWAAPAAAAVPAQRAPRVFTSNNYGVTFSVLPGLFHCPYPASWVGSDHGVNLYLTRPDRCDPAGGEAATGREAPPLIQVFYEHNVAEDPQPDGTTRPPATNQELLAESCDAHTQPVPAGLTLLGAPAAGCVMAKGSHISLVIGSLYAAFPDAPSPQPDSDVILTLQTTKLRYRHDFTLFREVAASLTLCTITGERPTRSRARCHGLWW